MPTPFSTLINRFFRRIEEDKNYFDYYNLTNEQAMSVAYERAKGFLYEATELIMLKATPTVDLTDYDETYEQFNFDLNNSEILLVSSFMYQQYLERTIAKLKEYNVNYTADNLKVFDPSNARSTFQSLYERVCEDNNILLDLYNNKDRETNEVLSINYADYDEEE